MARSSLKFLVFDKGQPVEQIPLRNAYLIGADQNAIKAEIRFEEGQILCKKRDSGTAALALQVPAGDCGELTLQTTLLPDREQPYLLSLELARHRLMMLYNKLEDWGMFDRLADDHPVMRRVNVARKRFIESLCHMANDQAKADKLARESLQIAVDGTEELALAHAELLLNRRKDTKSIPKYAVGAGMPLHVSHEHLRAGLRANFDVLSLCTPWKDLCEKEGEYNWDHMDQWAEWAARNRMPIMAGPLVCFDPMMVPDWLLKWKDRYQAIRDFIYDHVERVVKRYKQIIGVWKIVSGLHVNRHFKFNFEQIIELTRLCAMLVKRVQPQGRVLVEIAEPFGEYFGQDQRSIPPLMYCDLLVQGAVSFDGFSIKLLMGQAQPGHYCRDLMQVSQLLDLFAGYGKPAHLNLAAPSQKVTAEMIAPQQGEQPVDDNSGYWRAPWSPVVQSHWLEAVYHVAFSRPHIESVIWHDMVDHEKAELPLAGLVNDQLQGKAAFRKLVQFRKQLTDETAGGFLISLATL